MSDNYNQSTNDSTVVSSDSGAYLFQLAGAVNPNGNTSLSSIEKQKFIAKCFGTTREQFMSSPYIHNENEGMQKINLVISDLDNTLVDSYTGAAEMLLVLEKYIAKETGCTVARIHNILRKEINTEKHFASSDFFSAAGYKKILSSSIWGRINVSDEIVKCFEEGFKKSYSCAYPDALELFKTLRILNIPLVIHTDAPLEQAVDKLIKGGFISLKRDEKGKLHATSLIAGISASNRSSSKDPIAQAEANKQMAEIKEALDEINVFVFAYDKEIEKPSPKPLERILSELERTSGLTFAKENILMIGDSLTKDIFFAINAEIKSAWMLGCTRASDNIRHLEHATCANRHPMSWQKQIKLFKVIEGAGQLLADTTICISHCDLFRKYKFESLQTMKQQDLLNKYKLKSPQNKPSIFTQLNMLKLNIAKNLADASRIM